VVALMQDIVNAILNDRQDTLVSIYEKYVDEVLNVQDISRWCAKKTLTDPVMSCKGYEARIEMHPNKKGVMKPKKVYYIKGKRKPDMRTNEVVVWDAVKHEELVQQGDKVYLYPKVEQVGMHMKVNKAKKTKKTHTQKLKFKGKEGYGLKQGKYWNKDKPDHDVIQLLKRLHDTMKIFKFILDMDLFKNYSLVENYKKLLDKSRQSILY